jgi:glutathione reductase (NADPH)
MVTEFDLIVIGGGSGGLACAQRAAEYGARGLLIESHRLGGTCVNVGCVPKKIIWNAAQLAHAAHDALDYGFDLTLSGHDWALLRQKRDAYIARLNDIYAANLERSGVTLLRERASLTARPGVRSGGQDYRASHIVLATGGHPVVPGIPGAELGITSDDFFALPARPADVAIVGSGYIAVELAGLFSALGTHTTLLARGERLLRTFEPFLGAQLLETMREEGIEPFFHATPTALRRDAQGKISVELADGRRAGPFDTVLWATGRKASVAGLGLEAVRVLCDAAGFVRTDPFQETNVSGIYAIGDATGREQYTRFHRLAAGRRDGCSAAIDGGSTTRTSRGDLSHPPIGTVGPYSRREVKVHSAGFVLHHALTTRVPGR